MWVYVHCTSACALYVCLHVYVLAFMYLDVRLCACDAVVMTVCVLACKLLHVCDCTRKLISEWNNLWWTCICASASACA